MFSFFPVFLCLAAAIESGDLPSQVKKFVDVLALLEQEAAEPVSSYRAVYEGAIPGMLRTLDPHSVFFDPGQFDQLKELQSSTRKGFGSVVSVLPGRVIVLQTLPGTPSAKAGMMAGDQIVAINGIRLDYLDIEQLIGLLSESRRRQVSLDVRRTGNARIQHLVLTPEEMQSPSVERAFLLEPGIGYVRVTSFDTETGSQIRQAIERLGGASLTGMVLDLRDNPGGVLPAALETASLFLEPGRNLLSVKGRSVTGEQMKVSDVAKPYRFLVAVLLNGKSASASEIVAGALQDYRRAAIVGEPSFGKGLVESVYPLSGGAGLALTTAFYYTPSGRSIQRPLPGTQLDAATRAGDGGIKPDFPVWPEGHTRLGAVLDATGSFATYATIFLQKHGPIKKGFELTPEILDDFQGFLAQRNIQPGVSDWSRERAWIESRLKQEIANQGLGVEAGDEIEAQRDPQIQKAVQVIRDAEKPTTPPLKAAAVSASGR
ncbi:MAG: S41 family peptidase [Bryobacteraceae bacterium]|nr:S41 family peptidase [Bryobacterales bacterium]NUM99707.1 S41 family peptidase [Bryobacteraceae bacterium]